MSDMDAAYFQGVALGLNLKIGKKVDFEDVRSYLAEEALPNVMAAKSIEDIDKAIAKAYGAYPDLKEQIYSMYDFYGGNAVDPKSSENPIIIIIIRIIVAIVLAVLGARPAQ